MCRSGLKKNAPSLWRVRAQTLPKLVSGQGWDRISLACQVRKYNRKFSLSHTDLVVLIADGGKESGPATGQK